MLSEHDQNCIHILYIILINIILIKLILCVCVCVCGGRELKRRKVIGGGHSITKIFHQFFSFFFPLTLKH